MLGSGISRVAGIPTGWEISLKLIEQISILEKQKITSNPETWFNEYFNEPPDYSNILERLTNTKEERINLLRTYFEPTPEEFENGLKKPTIAHQKIAQLVQEGYIKVIVTTNFDRLMENALKDLGIEPIVISNPAHIENTTPLVHNRITILKINGDYLDTKFLNIKSELEEYDDRINNTLNFVFENYGLITSGWSAKWDSGLVNILKSSNKFRYSNYFTYTNLPSPEIIDLCNFRKGNLVNIHSADILFGELTENIKALENNLIENPLSTKVAVARVKKYLTKEEYIISLSEIVQNCVEECYKKMEILEFPKPDNNTVKEIINVYFKYLEPLNSIIVEGGYWSKDYQKSIWIKALIRIGTINEKNTGGYEIWRKLKDLPLLITRYVFGIASLANGNLHLIKEIFKIKVRRESRDELKNILQATHILKIIDNTALNAVIGQSYKTAMSQFLFLELRKYFIPLIPSDKDFEDIFDYYEYISCLVYLKSFKEEFLPIGRFLWRDRTYINLKLSEATNQQDNFELIECGLFSNSEELNSLTIVLNEKLKKMNFW